MSNLSLGTTYSNARGSLVTASGKTRSGGGGGSSGGGAGIGDVELTLPNIPVDVDWTLSSNQGPTLAVKNKPDPDFYKQPNNPFKTLQGVPPDGGANIDYVQVGAMDARSYVSAPTFSATQSIQTSSASNIQDFSGNPLFPQLGDVELQLQTVPTCVDWNLDTNQGQALAITNKPDYSQNFMSRNIRMDDITGANAHIQNFRHTNPTVGAWTGTVTTTGSGYQAPTAALVPLENISVLAPGWATTMSAWPNFAGNIVNSPYGFTFWRFGYLLGTYTINVTATSPGGITSLGILPLAGSTGGRNGNGYYGANTLTGGPFGGDNMLGMVTVPGATTLSTSYTGPFLETDEFTIGVAAPAGTVNFRLVMTAGLQW